MRKAELVTAVSKTADLSQRQADDVLAALIEQITNALARGESVSLLGFGAFAVKSRQSRMGRNPQTGADIEIPAALVPVFKAGKRLKFAVQS